MACKWVTQRYLPNFFIIKTTFFGHANSIFMSVNCTLYILLHVKFSIVLTIVSCGLQFQLVLLCHTACVLVLELDSWGMPALFRQALFRQVLFRRLTLFLSTVTLGFRQFGLACLGIADLRYSGPKSVTSLASLSL